MPRRDDAHVPIEELSPEARALIPADCQEHWYRLVARRIRGRTVLDVGAGAGAGVALFERAGAACVRGIDPLPAGPGVDRGTLEDVASESWDVAVAMDVIEHVEDDRGFLAGLLRVARRNVFLSTPNFCWEHARLGNPHHVREYTPAELAELLDGLDYDAWVSGLDRVPRRITSLEDAGEVPNFGVWIRLLKGAR